MEAKELLVLTQMQGQVRKKFNPFSLERLPNYYVRQIFVSIWELVFILSVIYREMRWWWAEQKQISFAVITLVA